MGVRTMVEMRAVLGIRLVLLDRDGTIIRHIGRDITQPEEVQLIPGADAAIAHLNRAGIKVALCSNQDAVGRGEVDPGTLAAINERLQQLLQPAGAHLDAIYDCCDPPAAATPRRKPAPGLLQQAIAEFGVDAARTPMIGDEVDDMRAAAALGCPRHLVRTGLGELAERRIPDDVLPVRVHDTVAEAIMSMLDVRRSILGRRRTPRNTGRSSP